MLEFFRKLFEMLTMGVSATHRVVHSADLCAERMESAAQNYRDEGVTIHSKRAMELAKELEALAK